MSRIFYFNITYRCNQNCVFCFSNSTSSHGRDMKSEKILDSLKDLEANERDLIVLNGGEPSLHPHFYDLLSLIQNSFHSQITVYSNGSVLDVAKMRKSSNTIFIIPIHGNENEHDAITQIYGAFQNTLNNIKAFTNCRYRYSIKFIVNSHMVSDGFDIKHFLESNRLTPEEIIIARLNSTTKSKSNQVDIPSINVLAFYVQKQIGILRNQYKIKLVDIAPCLLGEFTAIKCATTVPAFYFSDTESMQSLRLYYKDILIGNNCDICKYTKVCRTMRHSYLTLSISGNQLQLERE